MGVFLFMVKSEGLTEYSPGIRIFNIFSLERAIHYLNSMTLPLINTRFYGLCSANFSSQDSDINVVLHALLAQIRMFFQNTKLLQGMKNYGH